MIVRAPELPLRILDAPLTPLLLERASQHSGKAAFIDGDSGCMLTFARMAQQHRPRGRHA
jgi:hypothetical protein